MWLSDIWHRYPDDRHRASLVCGTWNDGVKGVDRDMDLSSDMGLWAEVSHGVALLHTYRGTNIFSCNDSLWHVYIDTFCHVRWTRWTHSSIVFIGVHWSRLAMIFDPKGYNNWFHAFLFLARTEPVPLSLFHQSPPKRHPANVISQHVITNPTIIQRAQLPGCP